MLFSIQEVENRLSAAPKVPSRSKESERAEAQTGKENMRQKAKTASQIWPWSKGEGHSQTSSGWHVEWTTQISHYLSYDEWQEAVCAKGAFQPSQVCFAK